MLKRSKYKLEFGKLDAPAVYFVVDLGKHVFTCVCSVAVTARSPCLSALNYFRCSIVKAKLVLIIRIPT